MVVLKVKRIFASKDTTQRYLRRHAKRARQPLRLPNLKSMIAISEEAGFPVVTLSLKDKVPHGVVVMFHGGAYVRSPLADHWRFADLLVQRTGWQVILPIYPKAPVSTVTESLAKVMPLVQSILSHHHPVIIMGDSAGGGLALAISELLAKASGPLPEHLILMSPWLDIALRHQQSEALDTKDPILSCVGLREIGQVWSGNLSPDDPRVSPLFGLTSALPPMTVITGTREIFYPDVLTLTQHAKRLGIDVELIIGEGLFHCYPLFDVPESQRVRLALEHLLITIENRR
jgi:acetyl esterase/lipase